MNTPVYVDGKLFLGRVEEQKRFRAALNEVLHPPPGETLPYIFLLYGDGGMGKTTLAKRFRDIACDEAPFERNFQILWVDWEDERRRTPRLQGGRAHVSPETVFDILHAKAVAAGWGHKFSAYQRAVQVRGEAQQKAAAALEPSGERDDLAALRGAGAAAIAKILRMGLPPIGETGEKLAQAFLPGGGHLGGRGRGRPPACRVGALPACPPQPRTVQPLPQSKRTTGARPGRRAEERLGAQAAPAHPGYLRDRGPRRPLAARGDACRRSPPALGHQRAR